MRRCRGFRVCRQTQSQHPWKKSPKEISATVSNFFSHGEPAPGRCGPLRPTESDPVKLHFQDFSELAINFPTSVSQQETFGMFLHLFVPCPVAFQNQRCGSSVTSP